MLKPFQIQSRPIHHVVHLATTVIHAVKLVVLIIFIATYTQRCSVAAAMAMWLLASVANHATHTLCVCGRVVLLAALLQMVSLRQCMLLCICLLFCFSLCRVHFYCNIEHYLLLLLLLFVVMAVMVHQVLVKVI